MTIEELKIASSYLKKANQLKEEIEKIEPLLNKKDYDFGTLTLHGDCPIDIDINKDETTQYLQEHLNDLKQYLKLNLDKIAAL